LNIFVTQKRAVLVAECVIHLLVSQQHFVNIITRTSKNWKVLVKTLEQRCIVHSQEVLLYHIYRLLTRLVNITNASQFQSNAYYISWRKIYK